MMKYAMMCINGPRFITVELFQSSSWFVSNFKYFFNMSSCLQTGLIVCCFFWQSYGPLFTLVTLMPSLPGIFVLGTNQVCFCPLSSRLYTDTGPWGCCTFSKKKKTTDEKLYFKYKSGKQLFYFCLF